MKTNAIRILDTLGIRYELRDYEVDSDDLTIDVGRNPHADGGCPPRRPGGGIGRH